MSVLAFVSAIHPALDDAPAVAAMLAAAGYKTVSRLPVLLGSTTAESHEELELLGISCHFDRRSLLLAIRNLPAE